MAKTTDDVLDFLLTDTIRLLRSGAQHWPDTITMTEAERMAYVRGCFHVIDHIAILLGVNDMQDRAADALAAQTPGEYAVLRYRGGMAHAVEAAGSPADGSLYGFTTLCGRHIDKLDAWHEEPRNTPTECGRCLRVAASFARTAMEGVAAHDRQ